MLMVIFGAGASFDSSPTYPLRPTGPEPPGATVLDRDNGFYRPPLAKDLFANRPLFISALDLFPQCKTIVPRLRDNDVTSGRTSIESLLQVIESEAGTYAKGHQELAAIQCYLQRAVHECQSHWRSVTRGVTNYLYLLREIERVHKDSRPVCLVTFNYDTLLEEALEGLEHKIEHMEDYADESRLFRVFKPHGSVNWAQIVKNELPANVNMQHPHSVLRYLVENASSLRVSDTFVLCNPGTMGVAGENPTFPAIAIPVERKNRFVCPKPLLDRLIEVLPHVSKILVIGWRATEEHFLNLLRMHLKPEVRLHVVAGGPKDAQDARVRICRALINARPAEVSEGGEGFTKFVLSDNLKSFI